MNWIRMAAYVSICMMGMALCSCSGARKHGAPPVLPPMDRSHYDWSQQTDDILRVENQFAPREEYVLGAGDVVEISLVGRMELLETKSEENEGFIVTLSESPTISLPHVGAIPAHGRTVPELEESIRVAYDRIVKDPVPVVRVIKHADYEFSIIGSVKTPGNYTLKAGDTILDGIYRAGGLNLAGSPPDRIVKIYRNRFTKLERYTMTPNELIEKLAHDGSSLSRREIVLPLDTFILGGDLRWNVPIHQNDIIYIPPAGTVSAHGLLHHPRVVFLGPSLRTLVEVLTECNGMKYEAASVIELVRTNPDGNVDYYFFNGRRVLNRKERDFYVENNDQIFIYRSNLRTAFGVFGKVFGGATRAGVSATYNPVPVN